MNKFQTYIEMIQKSSSAYAHKTKERAAHTCLY